MAYYHGLLFLLLQVAHGQVLLSIIVVLGPKLYTGSHHSHTQFLLVGIKISYCSRFLKSLIQMTQQQYRTLGCLIHTADTFEAGKIGHRELTVRTEPAPSKRKSKLDAGENIPVTGQ